MQENGVDFHFDVQTLHRLYTEAVDKPYSQWIKCLYIKNIIFYICMLLTY